MKTDHGGEPMATLGRRGYLAGLFLLLGVICTGCNVMALPYFILPEPTIEPKFKLASEDKEREVRVVLLASSNVMETRAEFLRIDRELSQQVGLQMQHAFKENKEKVTVVPTSRVEKFKDENPTWKAMSPKEIGAHFKADYVIDLEIHAISLYEQGSDNMLYMGRASVAVDVVDVHKPAEGFVYQTEYTIEYPRRGPLPASSNNPAQFRQRLLTRIAKELAWLFTEHPAEDEHRMDD
jgi:hypothetical protein